MPTLMGTAQRKKKYGSTASSGGSALPSGSKANSPAERIASKGKTKGVVRTASDKKKKTKKNNY